MNVYTHFSLSVSLSLQDKDNSKTVETEEVCAFAKKVVQVLLRTAKNVVPLLSKTLSTVMSSEAADKVL